MSVINCLVPNSYVIGAMLVERMLYLCLDVCLYDYRKQDYVMLYTISCFEFPA